MGIIGFFVGVFVGGVLVAFFTAVKIQNERCDLWDLNYRKGKDHETH